MLFLDIQKNLVQWIFIQPVLDFICTAIHFNRSHKCKFPLSIHIKQEMAKNLFASWQVQSLGRTKLFIHYLHWCIKNVPEKLLAIKIDILSYYHVFLCGQIQPYKSLLRTLSRKIRQNSQLEKSVSFKYLYAKYIISSRNITHTFFD